MAISSNAPPLTWDDLLEAINPQPPSPEERLRGIIATGVQLHREGRITDAEIDLLLKVAIGHLLDHKIYNMVVEYFSPPRRRTRNEGFLNDLSFL